MIVTIDGPAGAGKSSVSRGLADRLGFRFLDTGAMYRVVAHAALQGMADLEDAASLADVVRTLDLQFDENRVLVNNRDVTSEIRLPEVTAAVRFVADNLAVRNHLSNLQRKLANAGNIVTEGRDQGTVVFPNAECKIYLTASADVRAQRRYQEMIARGVEVSADDILRQQKLRDKQDTERPVGRLQKADDAIEIITDNMSTEDVLDQCERLVRNRF